ncbi:MAG: hypothetical protein KIT84_30495 [Labilithrix sp.]|nr:hypothetical protein [Labilithrix sp.]MCW5815396.1 hypothetical protein [Labilithrix sp.]
MKLGRALALLVLGACVPATEELNPRGGVVARLSPSAETAGTSFTSVDGWTVTIERFAVRASVSAQVLRVESDRPYGYGGGGYPRILAPNDACELKLTAMSPGPAAAYIELRSRYAEYEPLAGESLCGIDDDLRERFDRRADGSSRYEASFPGEFEYRSTPSLVLLARAEKAGRALRLELGLDAELYGPTKAGLVPVTIVANEGAPIRVRVDAAALFVPPERRGQQIRFDDVAAADADGDGVVTGGELADVDLVDCEPVDHEDDPRFPLPFPGPKLDPYPDDLDDFGDTSCGSVLDAIARENVANLFGPAP